MREKKLLGHVENQQGTHAVIGEALPHFREEQDIEALGMTEKGFAVHAVRTLPFWWNCLKAPYRTERTSVMIAWFLSRLNHPHPYGSITHA
jgi:hypothetical protein